MCDDDEAKRLNLIRNERLKLSATYLNGIAIALMAVGGFAPSISVVTGASAAQAGLAAALLGVCTSLSVALHLSASRLLKGLR